MATSDKNILASFGGSDGEDALTCIHGPIHCAAADVPDEGEDDLQQIDVRNFIDALARLPSPLPAVGRI